MFSPKRSAIAVNTPRGKNSIGAFYQPQLVIADTALLETLPARELRAGYAEIVKYGLINDPDFFAWLEEHGEAVLALDPGAIAHAVATSCRAKAAIVAEDERETGVRALLNYGHTIGHALEAVTGYSALLHGEAVSIGMMGAGHISSQMGLLSEAELERQRALLEAFGLPLSYPDVDADAVIHAMRSDKKTQDKAIHWVLLDGIGNAVTRSDVPPDLVRETLVRLAR